MPGLFSAPVFNDNLSSMDEQKRTAGFHKNLFIFTASVVLAGLGCETTDPSSPPTENTDTETSGHCQMGTIVFPNGDTQCLPLERRPVTLVLYFVADGDLEATLMQDINEAEAADLPKDAHIIVLIDRADGFDETDGDWTGAKTFSLTNDNTPKSIRSPRVSVPALGLTATSKNGEELDMGSPETLSQLIDFASNAFPSNELLLHLNGHGGGWGPTGNDIFRISKDAGYRAFGRDASSGNYLDVVDDLPGALAGRGVDAITFEACGMGNIETIFAVWPHVDGVGASSMPIPQSGFDYTALLDSWRPPVSAQSWLSATVDAFTDSFDDSQRVSWAVYDTTGHRSAFAEAVDRLVRGLEILEPENFRSLRDIIPQPNWQQPGMRDLSVIAKVFGGEIPKGSAEPIEKAVEDLIVASHKSAKLPFMNHLLVYLPGDAPEQGGPYNPDYEQTDFAAMTGWDELIRKYY